MDDWLEHTIAQVMESGGVPGLALAIINQGQPVAVRGFGLRDIERRLPVTIETPFNICSLTKSATAIGLAMLVDNGRLNWDRPVRKDMPDLHLKDPAANAAITLRDMLAHRSGLPRHDWVWMPGDRGCDEMFRILGELEPSRPFRSVFQYQNLIYMAAGMLAGRVVGMTYEEFI